MIRAHMATYPARRDVLELAVRAIARQVDRIYLVLNDYAEVPAELSDIANLEAIIPDLDLKDTGKFWPVPAADDVVVLADDDLRYNPDHVRVLLDEGTRIGLDRNVVGLHGSIYESRRKRTFVHMNDPLRVARRVHQLGTGTVLALGRNVAPFDYMAGSQKFVDVRYARWLANRRIGCWSVPRARGFLRQIEDPSGQRETIFNTFTRHRPQVLLDEISALIDAQAAFIMDGPIPGDARMGPE
jgi:hypothetical protein